jgi:hypothetical protein
MGIDEILEMGVRSRRDLCLRNLAGREGRHDPLRQDAADVTAFALTIQRGRES